MSLLASHNVHVLVFALVVSYARWIQSIRFAFRSTNHLYQSPEGFCFLFHSFIGKHQNETLKHSQTPHKNTHISKSFVWLCTTVWSFFSTGIVYCNTAVFSLVSMSHFRDNQGFTFGLARFGFIIDHIYSKWMVQNK